MNLLLLTPNQQLTDALYRPSPRQIEHIKRVHKAGIGDALTVGLENELMGKAEIVEYDGEFALKTNFNTPPPAKLPLHLIVALPRPKMIKRIVQTATTMGVERLTFLNSYRVEKSYWQTPLIAESALHEHMTLGLEQAQDTVFPLITLEKRFKPFVEDRLPDLLHHSNGIVAHPYSEQPCPFNVDSHTTLVIGPEGGFIPYEVEKLIDAGCNGVTLGKRILRVETAVPTLISRLFI